MGNIAAFQREAQATALARIPLRTAYLCLPCRIIMDGAPEGVCRICGSSAIWSVGSLILSPEDRQAWLLQIRGLVKERLVSKSRTVCGYCHHRHSPTQDHFLS